MFIRRCSVRLLAFAACALLLQVSQRAWSGPVMPDQEGRATEVRQSHALELGLNYLTGHNVPRDTARAAQLLRQAAEAGEPEAQTRLGMMYQTGTGVAQDYAQALHWYQLAASSGGVAAKVNMAILYARGSGVAADPHLAAQLFQQAFAMGYGPAAAYLGELYFAGTGVPRDQKSAEEWFKKGAKKHDVVSMYDMGVIYTGEGGHVRDLAKSAEFFRKAAKGQYVPAEYALGLLIVRRPEFGLTQDEGLRWLEAASAAGFWKADAVLGILSRDGVGVPKSQEQALYHFRLAVAQGGARAQKLVNNDLRALANSVSAEKSAEIAERADAWAKSHPPMFLLENGGAAQMLMGGSLGLSEAADGKARATQGQVPPA